MIEYIFQAKSTRFDGNTSPFHISSGRTIEHDDVMVTEFLRLKNAKNGDFPCLPGSSLRGYFRSIIESQDLTKRRNWRDDWRYVWFSNVGLESAIRSIERVIYHPPMQKKRVGIHAEFLTIPDKPATEMRVYCCTKTAKVFFEELLGKVNDFFVSRMMMDHQIARNLMLPEEGVYKSFLKKARGSQIYYLKLGRFCGRQWKITRTTPIPRHVVTIKKGGTDIPVGFLELTLIDKKEASNFEFS